MWMTTGSTSSELRSNANVARYFDVKKLAPGDGGKREWAVAHARAPCALLQASRASCRFASGASGGDK